MSKNKSILIGVIIGILISLPIAFMITGYIRNTNKRESSDLYSDLVQKGKVDYAYYFLGKRLYQEEFVDKGLEYLNKAIELNPNKILYLDERMEINKYLNRYDETIADLKRILEIDPENISAMHDLAFYYSDKGMERTSIKMLTDRINSLPELGKDQPSDGREKLYFARAGAHYYLAEYDEAFRDLDKATGINPSNLPMVGDRATFNERLGRMKEAKAAAMIILTKFPRPGTTIEYQHYGTAYRMLGDYKKSIELYTKSAEVSPYNHIVIFERAMVHLKNNDKESARRDLQYVIDKDSPDKREAQEILKKLDTQLK